MTDRPDRRTLVVIRHAKSDWTTESADEQRPLNERGRRDAPAIGVWLAERFTVELVLSSPALRARQTWQLAAPAVEPTAPVRYDDRIYAAGYRELLGVVEELPGELRCVGLVGHNPGLSDLVTFLGSRPHQLKTASIAVLRWDGSWPDVWSSAAELTDHTTARG